MEEPPHLSCRVETLPTDTTGSGIHMVLDVRLRTNGACLVCHVFLWRWTPGCCGLSSSKGLSRLMVTCVPSWIWFLSFLLISGYLSITPGQEFAIARLKSPMLNQQLRGCQEAAMEGSGSFGFQTPGFLLKWYVLKPSHSKCSSGSCSFSSFIS